MNVGGLGLSPRNRPTRTIHIKIYVAESESRENGKPVSGGGDLPRAIGVRPGKYLSIERRHEAFRIARTAASQFNSVARRPSRPSIEIPPFRTCPRLESKKKKKSCIIDATPSIHD